MGDLGVNRVSGKKVTDNSQVVPTVKGSASKDALKPLPKSEEELDRDEYAKILGRPPGIADQKGFAEFRKKKQQKLTSLAPK